MFFNFSVLSFAVSVDEPGSILTKSDNTNVFIAEMVCRGKAATHTTENTKPAINSLLKTSISIANPTILIYRHGMDIGM